MIWQFTSVWNDFLFGVIVTSRPSVQPITVALNNMAGSYIVEWNVQVAGSIPAAIPPAGLRAAWALCYARLAGWLAQGLIEAADGIRIGGWLAAERNLGHWRAQHLIPPVA
jgi:hypothetical protein